ncbi:MAG: DUF4097 family beta strand repeat-containing protein [Leucobacter sp.]
MTENAQPDSGTNHASQRPNGVLIATSVVGGVLLVAAIATAAVFGITSLNRSGGEASTLTADARGVTALEVDAGSAEFSIVYDGAGSGEAVLETGAGGREWQLRRDGATLVVDSERSFFPDWLMFGPDLGQTVVLRLPDEMRTQRIDADFELSSGGLRAEGNYGELEVEVSSGNFIVSGSARSFDAGVSSGHLEFVLDDVEEASIDISSGRVDGELTGTAPASLEIDVSSGSVEVRLPDEAYAVSTRVSSGSIDNLLRTDPASPYRIDARVSSGGITLRPGE